MAKEDVIAYYSGDDFYEGAIEEGLTALLYDIKDSEDYVIITDGNGGLPESLEQEIIFACYRGDGAFLWSVTFESSRQFQEIWRRGGDGLAAVEAFRKAGNYYEKSEDNEYL